jgi:hypothetical protein
MNRTALKNHAPKARLEFIQAVTDRAAFFGLAPVPSGHWPDGTERTLGMKTARRKSSGALPVPSGESPLGTGQWPVPPTGATASTSESGLKIPAEKLVAKSMLVSLFNLYPVSQTPEKQRKTASPNALKSGWEKEQIRSKTTADAAAAAIGPGITNFAFPPA